MGETGIAIKRKKSSFIPQSEATHGVGHLHRMLRLMQQLEESAYMEIFVYSYRTLYSCTQAASGNVSARKAVGYTDGALLLGCDYCGLSIEF